VLVRFASTPEELADADLVVLPGTRQTVADLAWLRSRALDQALSRHDGPVLGICGGFQMLGREILDEVESRQGTAPGLGLLPASTVFAADKLLARPVGEWRGHPVTTAYEIHHGRVTVDGGEPFLDGVRQGLVSGTLWHGALESDGFRRAFLSEVATSCGRDWQPGTASFEDVRQARLDALGDLVADHLDTGAISRLIERGAPAGLPFVPPGAPV
jgi:adenosylcobyric acid synthase